MSRVTNLAPSKALKDLRRDRFSQALFCVPFVLVALTRRQKKHPLLIIFEIEVPCRHCLLIFCGPGRRRHACPSGSCTGGTGQPGTLGLCHCCRRNGTQGGYLLRAGPTSACLPQRQLHRRHGAAWDSWPLLPVEMEHREVQQVCNTGWGKKCIT
jgi:hypothetical protein